MGQPNGHLTHSPSNKSPSTSGLSTSLLLSVIPQWTWVLSLIFVGCCSNAYYLESSTSQIPNLGTLITFLQFLFTMLLALPSQLESASSTSSGGKGGLAGIRWRRNRVPLSRWGVQVLLYASTTLLNNTAFAYDVPMPVHIIFRSGGLVVNMLMGWLVRGKRYSLLQITSVFLVTFGVILSTISTSPSPPASGSSESSPSPAVLSKYFIGISLLFLALFLSSLMGIWQEITFQRYGKDHWQEAIFYSHALSMPLLGLRMGNLKEEVGLAMGSEKAWLGINAAGQSSLASKGSWPPPGGIWDFSILLPIRQLSSLLPSAGFYLPSILPLLALNILTQLACINGVNRLTARVSSVGVTLVLVVRKAVSLAISVLLVGGARGGDMKTLSLGAVAVGIGTVGYAWASSGGGGGGGGAARKGKLVKSDDEAQAEGSEKSGSISSSRDAGVNGDTVRRRSARSQ
ncbi:UAA transporter [Microstroma glucosiphilum]|uniref:UAA transporter n=1 Tax=Pseudomicrostroma glucosiphilum TaxID=1684307 RepID=A0A316U5K8_9BASI|nr:UAA transporter [Pseudomicrostroma glucosiphilum]PWN20118.1 UAA transporter [Pseudomicrostroma glucosiphilum]